jgi:hypothetical protein
MAVDQIRVLASVEVDEIDQRLANRDPSIDVGRLIPQLIATIKARDSQISGQIGTVVRSERELIELQSRFDDLQLEMTRERAVIEAARLYRASVDPASRAFEAVLRDFDAGKLVLGG